MLRRLCNFRFFYFLSLPRKGWKNKTFYWCCLWLVLFFFLTRKYTKHTEKCGKDNPHVCAHHPYLTNANIILHLIQIFKS